MERSRSEALGLASVMSRAPAVVHGLFLGAVSHAFSSTSADPPSMKVALSPPEKPPARAGVGGRAPASGTDALPSGLVHRRT
jgi:hypothetical protein